jgi:sec-independent protein translocase protein TatA
MLPLGLFGSLGLPEILFLLLLVVFLFGARRIPEIARGLGEGIRGFRASVRGEDGDAAGRDRRDDEGTRKP